jgi:hypothetical protein
MEVGFLSRKKTGYRLYIADLNNHFNAFGTAEYYNLDFEPY